MRTDELMVDGIAVCLMAPGDALDTALHLSAATDREVYVWAEEEDNHVQYVVSDVPPLAGRYAVILAVEALSVPTMAA